MKRRRGGRAAFGGYIVAAGIGCVAILGSGFAVAGAAWLLPSLAAWALERQPGRPMARAMALFGISAMVPDIAHLWRAGGDLDAGLSAAMNGFGVARAWSAQGAAWLLAEAAPAILSIRSEIAARRQLLVLEARRRDLGDEWSPEGVSPSPKA